VPGTEIVPFSPETAMPTERLEQEITSLAAHIHAATARWLLLVAEYDRRMAWADWDCKSCAHWLSWRCGLGMNAAREHLRVARSLVDLPVIRREFETGRLSFSQVRALTRVALPDNEAELVELARQAPTAQLEGMVRAFRGAVRAQELNDAKRRQATRHLTYYYDDDGSFVINGRLSPEEGAVVERALQAFESELEEQGFSAETLEDEIATEILEELGEKAFSYPELDQRDARALNEQEEARQKFFDAAKSHDYSRRRADALVALAESAGAAMQTSSNAGRYQVMVHVDAATLMNDDLDGRCELDDGPSLAPETLRRLGCDCSFTTIVKRGDEILDVGRKTRTVSTRLRRALEVRDRHCRFPACSNKVALDAHHIVHWIHHGETKLRNLCLLCRGHHRAVHEYGYEVRIDGGELSFFRPDGTVIARPEPTTSRPEMVVAMNTEVGLDIDAETSVPDWYGDRWDYDITVANLMRDHGVGGD